MTDCCETRRSISAAPWLFYLHGGAYAIGTAASSVGLASDLARRAETGLVTIDYRLAPEHPQPAAIQDAVAVYRGLLDSGVSPSTIVLTCSKDSPRSSTKATPP